MQWQYLSADGDVRPLREPSPALEDPPPPGGLAACEEEPLSQETINLRALDYFVDLFARAYHSG